MKSTYPGFNKLECGECLKQFSSENDWLDHIAKHQANIQMILSIFPSSKDGSTDNISFSNAIEANKGMIELKDKDLDIF